MANIFVIDDEPLLLDLICNTLRLDGHEVSGSSNPLAVFEPAPSLPQIDLLLTDVDMKPINGFEVVKRLNQLGFTGIVLFMSGYYAMGGTFTDSMGDRVVIEKPFTASQLRDTVRSALTRRMPKSSRAV